MRIALMMLAALCAASPAWAAKEKPADKEKAPAAEKAEAKEKAKPEAKEKAKPGDKAEAKEAAPEEGAVALEGEALAKARKKAMSGKKPFYMNKLQPAQKIAEAGQWPILVAVLPKSNSPALQELEKKVLMRKEFQEFVKPNLVVVILKVEPGKDPKKIDVRRFKPAELKILENFAVSERMISQAKQNNKDEPKFDDLSCYPMLVCVSSDLSKELFRMGSYDREAGFGVWLSQVADFLREAQIEPVISPKTQKIIDNPDDPRKWK